MLGGFNLYDIEESLKIPEIWDSFTDNLLEDGAEAHSLVTNIINQKESLMNALEGAENTNPKSLDLLEMVRLNSVIFQLRSKIKALEEREKMINSQIITIAANKNSSAALGLLKPFETSDEIILN